MKKRSLIYRAKGRLIRMMCPMLPDDVYLKLIFRHSVGYSLNLDDPKSYNEKLQWLKLNDKHKEYTMMVDKYAAKEFVKQRGGGKYVNPTLGVWDNAEEIDWESLPEQFVLKVTSDCGGIVVCKDKSKLDIAKAKEKLTKCWGRDYCKYNKEYPYKDVTPRIIAEKYLEDESGYELKDYKFFCFDGEPKFLYVATDRQKPEEEVKFDFFDLEWNHLPIRNGHDNNPRSIPKPKNFEEMIEVARMLSKGICHVRVDLYNCNGDIYFGEMTFFHMSGATPFEPVEWDYKFGEYIKLPIKKT